MAAGSSRRKFKRFQRQSAEQTATVEGLIALFQQYGIHIDFAWQLPEIVEQLLAANKGAIPQMAKGRSIGGGGKSPQDMLRQLSGGTPVVPRLGVVSAAAGRPAPRTVAAPEEEEVDEDLVAGLYEEYGSDEEEEEGEEGEDGMPMSQEEMVAAYQEKQAAMIRRVATDGVKYGKTGTQGPAAGKKLLPHGSTDKRILSAKKPQIDDSGLEEGLDMDLGSGPDEEDSSPAVESGPGDGRVNPKTGMSMADQRRLMSRVLGKAIKPPSPSGIVNTLKK